MEPAFRYFREWARVTSYRGSADGRQHRARSACTDNKRAYLCRHEVPTHETKEAVGALRAGAF